jgi:hypothetical protein
MWWGVGRLFLTKIALVPLIVVAQALQPAGQERISGGSAALQTSCLRTFKLEKRKRLPNYLGSREEGGEAAEDVPAR